MIITDKARDELKVHLKRLEKDLLYIFYADSSCCGHKELQLDLRDSKEFKGFEEVNGIKVFIEEDIHSEFEEVTMDFDGEGFMLKNLAHCGHHHHEGECCCGEDDCDCCEGECDCEHEHEDGECCCDHHHNS